MSAPRDTTKQSTSHARISGDDTSRLLLMGKPRKVPSMSPAKAPGASTRKLVSPVDSDQEQNDLEVASVLSEVRGLQQDQGLSPTKAITPFRPSTVMTNLQRGNVQTTTPVIQYMSIHQLAAQGELVTLQQMISSGADVNALDESGLTPLHWSCANGQLPTIEYLVRAGANIYVAGNNGENVLLLASCYGYSDIVKYLLNHGMDINYSDVTGTTALMYASYNNESECVTMLLESGADITAHNHDHYTAMDLAVGQQHKSVQNVIEKHMLSLFADVT